MTSPTISIIMPVSHTEKFLAEAVGSILTQTYRDLELITICVPLQEEVAQILAGFDDPRLRIIVPKAVLSVGVAMNYAKDYLQGEFVARMDSDDIALPDRFEKEITFLHEHPNVGVVGGQIEYINEDGSHQQDLKLPCSYTGILLAMPRYNPIANSTFLMRRKDYMALHYDPGMVYGNEDYDYWVRAARQGVIIRNLPDVVLKYRMKDRTKLGGVFYERNAQRNVIERGIRERARGLVSRNFNQILRSF